MMIAARSQLRGIAKSATLSPHIAQAARLYSDTVRASQPLVENAMIAANDARVHIGGSPPDADGEVVNDYLTVPFRKISPTHQNCVRKFMSAFQQISASRAVSAVSPAVRFLQLPLDYELGRTGLTVTWDKSHTHVLLCEQSLHPEDFIVTEEDVAEMIDGLYPHDRAYAFFKVRLSARGQGSDGLLSTDEVRELVSMDIVNPYKLGMGISSILTNLGEIELFSTDAEHHRELNDHLARDGVVRFTSERPMAFGDDPSATAAHYEFENIALSEAYKKNGVMLVLQTRLGAESDDLAHAGRGGSARGAGGRGSRGGAQSILVGLTQMADLRTAAYDALVDRIRTISFGSFTMGGCLLGNALNHMEMYAEGNVKFARATGGPIGGPIGGLIEPTGDGSGSGDHARRVRSFPLERILRSVCRASLPSAKHGGEHAELEKTTGAYLHNAHARHVAFRIMGERAGLLNGPVWEAIKAEMDIRSDQPMKIAIEVLEPSVVPSFDDDDDAFFDVHSQSADSPKPPPYGFGFGESES